MLIRAKTLKGYQLEGADGVVGKVKDFYFNDQQWMVCYLVADTGSWLAGRQVLLSPYAVFSVNKKSECIGINLSRKQIDDSPPLSADRPVSRQFEMAYYGYFGWEPYWDNAYQWGANPGWIPVVEGRKTFDEQDKDEDSHLRSSNDVSGHYIQAKDGKIGHVDDFIIDDDTWAIRYLVIDTKNWWAGKKVLLSTQWIERVNWEELKVFVNLSCDTIKQSPEYLEEAVLTREYETQLHQHYNRSVY